MITEEVAKHLEQILLVWLLLQVRPAHCRKLFVILTQILERYFFGKEQGYSGLRLGSAQLKTGQPGGWQGTAWRQCHYGSVNVGEGTQRALWQRAEAGLNLT